MMFKRCDCIRYLEVIMNAKLIFGSQVEDSIAKAKCNMGFLTLSPPIDYFEKKIYLFLQNHFHAQQM